ncbi:hypothetical protein GCM10009563_29470 [Subtercola frigoramans]
MPANQKYNVLAIVSLVSAFVLSLVAVITGHLALSQIKKTGEKGRGLALAGVILGYAGILAGIIVGIVLVVALATGAAVVKAGLDQSQALSSLIPTDLTLPTDDPSAGGSDASTQSVAEACTILNTQVSDSASALSNSFSSLQSDPAGAVNALQNLSTDFGTALGTITNPVVLQTASTAYGDLENLIADIQAYVADPSVGSSAIQVDGVAVQTSFTAIGAVCQ